VIDRAATLFTTRTAISPIWLVLQDTFLDSPPAGPVGVLVEQRRDGTWWPLGVPSRLTRSGNLAFPGLGRTTGVPGRVLDLRITVTAPRTVTESAPGGTRLWRTLLTWTPDRPPPVPAAETVRFLPAPGYVFGPGVPVLSGRVVAAGGDPVDGAHVSVTETVGGIPRIEEVRAGPDGGFRVPVRWSTGQARVDATLGPLSGFVIVPLPAGPQTRPVVILT
jgi:hypothetical protein